LRRTIAILSLLLLAWSAVPRAVSSRRDTSPQLIRVDTSSPGRLFPHFWEQMFGSGRAILSLRQEYRDDLRDVKTVTDFQYLRFHAIFHDEVGVYSESSTAQPEYNFSYVDQIYDGLLKNGVRPFVELSFMPKQLAAENTLHAFWYKPNVSPPKDYTRWADLVSQFASHLVDRYGINEVSRWYFEVWNEPNLDFWTGNPKQSTYFRLYDSTALALKHVSPRLRVGGPASAQAAWIPAFIQHAVQNKLPLDFVSTHVYGNDTSEDVFGTHENIPRTQMVCRAVRKVHDEIKASARPNLPLIWSEYNASYKNEPEVTDTIFMGPWLADTIRQCDGLANMMSYWTFSDVFEEQGVSKLPFYGGFGLIAEDELPKPSFNAFKLLHRLGDRRLPVDADDILVTRRSDGSLAIALWNLSLPQEPGQTKNVRLVFGSLNGKHVGVVSRLDADHGSLLKRYVAMGSPRYPTPAQARALRQAAQLPPPEEEEIRNGELNLTLAPKALLLVEVRKFDGREKVQ
jgi:xylan 1,4-beta-xylosidase